MNYFAHGYRFLDDPYFLAGTAVPDWLCVADRRVRARSKRAVLLCAEPDASVASVAAGIVQHHRDDALFHESRAFAQCNLQLCRWAREALPKDESFRPSFLGHILVEILLDAALIAAAPSMLDQYYAQIQSVDRALVESTVNRIAAQPTQNLQWFIGAFLRERFLADYLSDERLIFRLNQVMNRVRLSMLPATFAAIIPDARQLVLNRMDELLECIDVPVR